MRDNSCVINRLHDSTTLGTHRSGWETIKVSFETPDWKVKQRTSVGRTGYSGGRYTDIPCAEQWDPLSHSNTSRPRRVCGAWHLIHERRSNDGLCILSCLNVRIGLVFMTALRIGRFVPPKCFSSQYHYFTIISGSEEDLPFVDGHFNTVQQYFIVQDHAVLSKLWIP